MAGLEEGNVTYILLKQLLAVTVLYGLAINNSLLFYMLSVTSVCLVYQYMFHCGINVSSVP
jgi:hypothetical protein